MMELDESGLLGKWLLDRFYREENAIVEQVMWSFSSSRNFA